LKVPGTKRLNLKYDKLLTDVAFKFNLRRYILVGADIRALVQGKASNWTESLVLTSRSSRAGSLTKSGVVSGRGLHSFTLELNLSNSSTH
jgi:hypothetical protein